MNNALQRFSLWVSRIGSSTSAFVASIVIVVLWLVSRPLFDTTETWLITITVITDVIIFVMVFSIQNTQARDSKATRLKLNELITADRKARDSFIGLEAMTDAELTALDDEFQKILTQLEVHPTVHKLHKSIQREKELRPSFYKSAEHLIETLVAPLTPKR